MEYFDTQAESSGIKLGIFTALSTLTDRSLASTRCKQRQCELQGIRLEGSFDRECTYQTWLLVVVAAAVLMLRTLLTIQR